MRRGTSDLGEAEPPVEGHGRVRLQNLKADRMALLPCVAHDLREQRGSDALSLNGGIEDHVVHEDVIGEMLDSDVADGVSVQEDDLVWMTLPLAIEEVVLLRLVPRPELTLDHLAKGPVMDPAGDHAIGDLRRPALHIHREQRRWVRGLGA
jgi:hypothetical protein